MFARYPTVAPAEFISGVTSVEVPTTPLGLTIARSGAESPFKFESALLCTVAYSGDWTRGVEMLDPGTWRRWRLDGREERGVFADARAVYAGESGARDEVRPDDVQAFRSEVEALMK